MVRKAGASELEDIYSIYMERDGEDGVGAIKYTRDDIQWYLTHPSNASIFVMTHENKVVGFLLLYDMGVWGYLEHIVVSRDHRHKGYARRLLRRAIDHGKSRGWATIEACHYKDAINMKEFFRHLGWKSSGITTDWVVKELT